MGIEPTPLAWKAKVLPLNYTRLWSLSKDSPGTTDAHRAVNTGGGGRIRTSEGGAVRFTV